jgi:hypothetical protein
MTMAKPLLPDELWELIRPLIPPHPPDEEASDPDASLRGGTIPADEAFLRAIRMAITRMKERGIE